MRDKPQAFLHASPSGTVPCLETQNDVLDESLDIMLWALGMSDPTRWLNMPDAGHALIARCDGSFKHALDRTKYADRYPDADPDIARTTASDFIRQLDAQLGSQSWLFGDTATLADYAVLPFVRQFAHIDRAWFDAQNWLDVIRWLDVFLASDLFGTVMDKYAPWAPDQPTIVFPTAG